MAKETNYYGNSLNYGKGDIPVSRVPIWDHVDEQYPSGVFVKADSTNTVGKKIPAATPVSVDKLGGDHKIGSSVSKEDVTGLTRYDAWVGSEGCTLTVVTRGGLYSSRVEEEAGLTSDIQDALASRFQFIKED